MSTEFLEELLSNKLKQIQQSKCSLHQNMHCNMPKQIVFCIHHFKSHHRKFHHFRLCAPNEA